ncbi:hypothetical protein Enr10x_02410 [Gimesia panareensis]|uniref:DUF434 domain-containing protein n=1 Tax=Gimesia panareensis TaxID=2527978 RepID=A0A517Q012_9PLAN|nr:DUF434 domain-containing protein [Gimesia panareensis]QDT24947.1 hypothetical protein Enr10x_02410 [Gimesia panareensis]
MPDRRQHRGAHPQDQLLFAIDAAPELRQATCDLNWLLTRGYASVSALKLVGDRYELNARQRLAVARCACGADEAARRAAHQVQMRDLAEQELWLDGYNVLTSLEAALSGGVILQAHDGCFRDMASMHGSYRKVAETVPAIQILGELLAEWKVSRCRWLLDQPVSNSGRLKTMLREISEERGWNWEIDLVPDPDPVLIRADQVVASADSQILNQAERWFNLARTAIEVRVPEAWIVDLS